MSGNSYSNAVILGTPVREAASHLNRTELTAELREWERLFRVWDRDAAAPDWLVSLAFQTADALRSALRMRG